MTSALPSASQISMALDVLEYGQRPREGRAHCYIGDQISFSTEALGRYFFAGWNPTAYDLLLVAGVIEYCDLSKRRSTVHWPRTFQVRIPVHDPALWNSPSVVDTLEAAARIVTSDTWQFEFVRRQEALAIPPTQPLPLPNGVSYTIAYSDGLDSKAVAELLIEEFGPDAALRIRVGQTGKDVINRRAFIPVPFRVKASRKEASFRSRGFKFAAISAVAAKLGNVNRIIVPESGQGALGPAILNLRPTSPDYRNHPRFFRAMERFIGAVLEHTVSFEQPRLWSTKAETIREAHNVAGLSVNEITKTRSCWQKRNYVNFNGRFHQCGVCAACLLRRVSLAAAGIPEDDEHYTFANLSAPTVIEAAKPELNVRNPRGIEPHAYAACRHMHQFGQLKSNLGERFGFRGHASEIARATGAQADEVEKRLVELSERHSAEWQSFLDGLDERSFIKDLIRGLG
ncbi:MAG: 7-cyano-7-deazaguanine synthase [Pseudomonadota bacterium]